MTLLDELTRIAEVEFSAIVTGVQAIEPKRRIFLSGGSFLDVWVSLRLPDRFGFHWERRHLDGTVYRYDNFPDAAWRTVATFPHHFHDGLAIFSRALSFNLAGDGLRDFLDSKNY